MLRKNLLALVLLSGIAVFAQQEKEEKWNVSDPYTEDWPIKEVPLKTDEGTWMNLDVSPDGSRIVFDLLGDLYIMPVSGGKAKALRSGLAYEVQPRFSPDGTRIAFTSDAGGADNIWIMDSNGSDPHQLTEENFRLLNNAEWMPDGKSIVARKHFTSTRSLGAGEMWQYHIAGKAGLQLTERKNDQQDVNEPTISPDGRYLYYSEDVYPGGMFQYNKDPNKQIYVIKRYDMETGETQTVTGGPGGAARPQVSPKGDKLAFVRRVRTKTVLFIHDLETGQEWPVYDQLSKDQQEAWAIFGVYPGFSWMPDNKDVVIWSQGKILRIDTEDLTSTTIPFEVDNTIRIAETHSAQTPVYTESFNPKVIRHAVTSPDGKTMVFNAVGYLWKKRLPGGKPVRLTEEENFEFEPDFSPDGKQVVYVTWTDADMGAIKKVELNGGEPEVLSSGKGIYRTPAFSNDGNKIVFVREDGNQDLGHAYTKEPGIYMMNAQGEGMRKITQGGAFPTFSEGDKRILFQTGGTFFGNLTKSLKSVDLNGQDERTHVTSKYANRLVPSPNNEWIAFTNLHQAYLAPLIMNGRTIDLDDQTKAVPVRQISRDAGLNLHWSNDSQKVHWTLGEAYFTSDLSDKFLFIENAADSISPIQEKGIDVGLKIKYDVPKGSIAFTNARLITMDEDEVIENGTIVIQGNRIKAVGKSSEIEVPENAKIYDASGKTIMPGIVDVHAHIGAFRYGLTPEQHWPAYANLAFGVTTAHDPSALSETIFGMAELIKAGKMVGPRLFSTGIILYGADSDFKAEINSLEDARSALRRTKAFGANSVKSYNQPRREQRQQVMQAARELGMNVVPEGGSTFFHNMSMIMDGHTGIEHNIPVAPVYKDVKTLWSNSQTGYTPTLIVNYGGINGEYLFYERSNVWENERLLNFTPRTLVDSRSRHRTMLPDAEYQNGPILVSRTAKALTDEGVKVNLGAHGQLQGLGAHWELWLLQLGGMSNMEALQAATINGAGYLGMESEIGSLEEGKLADLLVLTENPLEDIRNTTSIQYTMVNGRLFESQTMNEIGNHPEERKAFYWEDSRSNTAFPWHQSTRSFTAPGCTCHAGSN